MREIERLYEQLTVVTDDNFYLVEADLFIALQRIPNEKKPQSVIAFNDSIWRLLQESHTGGM